MIKKKFLNSDGHHDCLQYALYKIEKKKAKINHLKALSVHDHDITLALQDCKNCNESSVFSNHNPIATLKTAFQNLAGFFVETKLYTKIQPK